MNNMHLALQPARHDFHIRSPLRCLSQLSDQRLQLCLTCEQLKYMYDLSVLCLVHFEQSKNAVERMTIKTNFYLFGFGIQCRCCLI